MKAHCNPETKILRFLTRLETKAVGQNQPTKAIYTCHVLVANNNERPLLGLPVIIFMQRGTAELSIGETICTKASSARLYLRDDN